MTKKIYSNELIRLVDREVPHEIIRTMRNNGWNAFRIYELVKEGLSLERKRNLTSRRSRAAFNCACKRGGWFDLQNICINCGGIKPPPA